MRSVGRSTAVRLIKSQVRRRVRPKKGDRPGPGQSYTLRGHLQKHPFWGLGQSPSQGLGRSPSGVRGGAAARKK